MPEGFQIEGTEQFRAAAKALNELGDREVRKAVYRSFREIAKPLGEAARDSGAEAMPHRGGLSARVAASKVGIRNSTTGRNPGVAIILTTREGYKLGYLNQGSLRHPVFGHRKTWRGQTVPAGKFTEGFEKGADKVRAKVIDALETTTSEAMRKAGL